MPSASGTRPAPSCPVSPHSGRDVPIGDRTGPNRSRSGRVVKHSSTRSLYGYWNERRGTRPAPERGDIEPGAIRTALGDAFILGCDSEQAPVFRLAGTRLCSLFGREIKGEAFEQLWDENDRAAIGDLLAIVGNEIAGIVAGVGGTTAAGDTVDLELLLLPLRHRGSSRTRQIGIMAPLASPFWLGSTPLSTLALKSHRHIGPALEAQTTTPLMAATAGGRIRHGLLVYDGGRT